MNDSDGGGGDGPVMGCGFLEVGCGRSCQSESLNLARMLTTNQRMPHSKLGAIWRLEGRFG